MTDQHDDCIVDLVNRLKSQTNTIDTQCKLHRHQTVDAYDDDTVLHFNADCHDVINRYDKYTVWWGHIDPYGFDKQPSRWRTIIQRQALETYIFVTNKVHITRIHYEIDSKVIAAQRDLFPKLQLMTDERSTQDYEYCGGVDLIVYIQTTQGYINHSYYNDDDKSYNWSRFQCGGNILFLKIFIIAIIGCTCIKHTTDSKCTFIVVKRTVFGILMLNCVCIDASTADYIFQPGLHNNFISKRRFGCRTAGCSITKTWQIVGNCLQPNVALNILQTDFNDDNETVLIYINDEYLGKCGELNEKCSDSWQECQTAHQYFENITALSHNTQITITLDATKFVGICAYNGYFLWSELTIECTHHEDNIDYVLDANTSSTQHLMGCDDVSCDSRTVWQITGNCPVATVSMSMMKIDSNEIKSIFINDHNLGQCQSNKEEYNKNGTWVDCINVQNYPIYNYNYYSGSDKYIVVYAEGWAINQNDTYTVNTSGAYYILANVTIGCVHIDYQFDLGLSGTYVWPQDDPDDKSGAFGCTYNGCTVSKSWQINGICQNPTLTLSTMDMNYGNASFSIDINMNDNHQCFSFAEETYTCPVSNQWFTCLYNDLSYYINETANVAMVNYIYLTITTNDDITTLCPYHDIITDTIFYLYVDVSLTCYVPDQCVLDSHLPQIITMVLITLTITTAIGVIIAGTFAAYKKGHEKALQQFLQTSVASGSAINSIDKDLTNHDTKSGVIYDDDDHVKNSCTPNITTPQLQLTNVNSQPTTQQTFCKFCEYLPKEILKKKSCYFPCITHLVDQSTDIAVIFEFYQLYVFESIPNPNGTKNDCSGVDALQLLILSCIAFVFYRIISCIWIYNIARSPFHTLLQFFDLKIYHALYINFISEYNDGTPNTAQKYIQILEASLEAFPQVVIQLYFFVQVKMDIEKYWIVFASLIMSLYNVASKMASEDGIYFIKSWQNMFVGKYLNSRYLFRYIVRLCDVFQRIMLILLLWIGIGGFYCAIYIIFEMIVLWILSLVAKEYVIHCIVYCERSWSYSFSEI